MKDCLKAYQRIFNNKQNFDESGNLRIESTIDQQEINKYGELLSLLTRTYSPLYTYNPNVLLEMNIEDVQVDDIVTKREQQISEILSNENWDAASYTFQTDIGYHGGWQYWIENLATIVLIVQIVIIIGISNVFAGEYQFGMAAVISTTKFGRSKLISAKILAATVVTFSLIAVSILIFSISNFAVFGLEGANLPIQMTSSFWLSLFPMTFGETFPLFSLISIIVSFMTMIVTLLCSAYSKSRFLSVIIGLSLTFFPLILRTNAVFSQFLNYLPINLTRFSEFLLTFKVIQMGTRIIPVNIISIFAKIIIFGVSLFFLKTKVKLLG